MRRGARLGVLGVATSAGAPVWFTALVTWTIVGTAAAHTTTRLLATGDDISIDSGSPCRVTDFGAKGDGQTIDTTAINAAMRSDRCDEILFPAGHEFVTGTIVLHSNKARTPV